MPKSKKPRKPYRHRIAMKPLNIKDVAQLERPQYVALAALDMGIVVEEHLCDLYAAANLILKMPEEIRPAHITKHAENAGRLLAAAHDEVMAGRQPRQMDAAGIAAAFRVLLPWIAEQSNRTIAIAAKKCLYQVSNGVVG